MSEGDDEALPDASDHDEEGITALLQFLHRSRGFDFSGYKRSTLTRRLQKRMQMVGVTSYGAYVDYLEVHPDEFPQLFNMLLINVTGFQRDPAAWESLRTRLSQLLAMRPTDANIRVWSAGCASGEEAYTLAMVFADLLGPENMSARVKTYATDLDEEALAQARLATYPMKSIEGLEPALVEKYFTRAGSAVTFNRELRRAVIFGRHDLVQDAPISRVDVLVCRNTLMYFNADTQKRVLSRLHFALADDGLLLLGKAEMLLTHANLFTPIDLKNRLFTRAERSRMPPRATIDEGTGTSEVDDERIVLQHAVFEAVPFALVVLDPAGRIALVNPRAAKTFEIKPQELGRPFQDLELSYRPAELRSAIDQARNDRRTVCLRAVERTLGTGEKTFLDIDVSPLFSASGGLVGTQLVFVDVTQQHRLQEEIRKNQIEIEAAHEELQSTSEELETTNEELQSTVEELETTNEELQSTNEELETMNEELQSTNEELQTMNDELRQRSDELNQVNSFFSSTLASLPLGVLVVDHEFLVRAWNDKLEDMWGLRADEVKGKNFFSLDIGLPVETLAAPLRGAFAEAKQVERTIDCINRRGRNIRCRITANPLKSESPRALIVVFEEVPA